MLPVLTRCVCICWTHNCGCACTQQGGASYKSRALCVALLDPQGLSPSCGLPGSSYRHNVENSSQRGQAIFLAEERTPSKNGFGSMVVFESHNINRVVLTTAAAELHTSTLCFGTCQFLRGLWMDISAALVAMHMRTDANSMATTASTARLPTY